ncbi:MAG TPA: lysis system i-spanin subunit Rz [Paralcaligenes sp.]
MKWATGAINFLRKNWLDLALLFLALSFLAVIYFTGVSNGRHARDLEAKAELARISESHTQALLAAADTARRMEKHYTQQMALIDEKHTKELNNEKAMADSTITALRAGAIRMRDRFTCAAGTGLRLPQVGTTAGMGDGATAGGLQIEDGTFLIREAERANKVATQLAACQAIVKSDRDGKNHASF